MEALKELRSGLYEYLEHFADKGVMSTSELQSVHMVTDTIKNIDKIMRLEDYSYGHESGVHYVRGHYSKDDGKEKIVKSISNMMNDDSLSMAEKEALKRAVEAFQ